MWVAWCLPIVAAEPARLRGTVNCTFPRVHLPVGWVHIGKNAGTEMDTILSHVRGVIGRGLHADYGWVKAHGARSVIATLRHPVDRAISNIEFWKTLAFTRGWKFRSMDIDAIVADRQEFAGLSGAWADGHSAVSWLTGYDTPWYAMSVTRHTPIRFDDARVSGGLPGKSSWRGNQTLQTILVDKAMAVFRTMPWVGLVDRLHTSTELLAYQLHQPLPTPGHANAHRHQKGSPETRRYIESMLPMDMAVYNMARVIVLRRIERYRQCAAKWHHEI